MEILWGWKRRKPTKAQLVIYTGESENETDVFSPRKSRRQAEKKLAPKRAEKKKLFPCENPKGRNVIDTKVIWIVSRRNCVANDKLRKL